MTSLSIIVGARSDEPSASGCLRSLSGQVSADMEIILVEDRETPASDALPEYVKRFVRPGGLVPQLWAEGLRHATGDLVGLLATTGVPAPDWVACTLALHRGEQVGIGGAIEPGSGLHTVDWAIYFCRYAPYLRPISTADDLEVPGDNASYRHDVLVNYRHLYEDGFWEPSVHRSMRVDGHRLSVAPERVVTFQSRTPARQFSRQRFLHGRAHGQQRSVGQGRKQILVRAMSFPLVPPLLTLRVARTVLRKQRLRCRFLAATPLIMYFYTWWAIGELAGRVAAARRPQLP